MLRLVDETKTSIRGYTEQIVDAQSHLRQDNTDLKDTARMNNALQRRVEKLHLEKADMVRSGPEDTSTKILQVQQQRQEHYAQELQGLVGSFSKFVNEYLAILIAAEQLGGPVVGDDLSIDEETLRSGFNKLGKVKKTRAAKRNVDDREGVMNEGDIPQPSPGTEGKAAGAGFRKLTEELLNALADEENRDSYIAIGKESAAVRFLVRANVAQFDPVDARRLRLMDFGSEVEHKT